MFKTYRKNLPKCHHSNPYRSYFWKLSANKTQKFITFQTKIHQFSLKKGTFIRFSVNYNIAYAAARANRDLYRESRRATILTKLLYATAKARIRRGIHRIKRIRIWKSSARINIAVSLAFVLCVCAFCIRR